MPSGKGGAGPALHCSEICRQGERIGSLISVAEETVLCRELWALGECIKVCAVEEQDMGLMYVIFRDSKLKKADIRSHSFCIFDLCLMRPF